MLFRSLQGHRDAVTCLSFRRDSYSLFSGSLDRCLKHWDLNEMGYLETMFGHQVIAEATDFFKACLYCGGSLTPMTFQYCRMECIL